MVFAQGIRIARTAMRQQKMRTNRLQRIHTSEPLRFDVLVESCVLVEVKAVEKKFSIHKAQILSYMKLLNVPLGLLLNFHELKLTNGVSRLILPGANL
jgi:GxxExxY protein